jgi:long-chain acyl-CoA synthetase
VITEYACASQSLVVVPLYDTLGPDAIKFILKQTAMTVVVVAGEKLEHLLNVAPECPALKYVIKIGQLTAEDKQKAKDARVSLLYFKGVEALGKDSPKTLSPPKPEDLLTICYTSGTTVFKSGTLLQAFKRIICLFYPPLFRATRRVS